MKKYQVHPTLNFNKHIILLLDIIDINKKNKRYHLALTVKVILKNMTFKIQRCGDFGYLSHHTELFGS